MNFITTLLKKKIDTELLFTETGSFAYEIKSKNVDEEFFKWKYLLNFSNYLKDSKFFDDANKKVIGIMKDEMGGVIIVEFIGLKSKMYAIKKIDGRETNTAKGVSIATEFNEFEDVFLIKKLLDIK